MPAGTGGRYCFRVSGGGAVLNIYDALYKYKNKINHIRTAHEQGAAHAADGYARSSGKTGVCIATSGPGATNLGLCQEKFAISGLRNMNQAAFCSNAWTDVGFKYARETDQSSAYSMR